MTASSSRWQLVALWGALLALGAAPALAQAPADTDILQEYRVTAYPSYRITDQVSGFGYVGWVYKPDARYTSYYLGKGVFWSPVKWLRPLEVGARSADRFQPRSHR